VDIITIKEDTNEKEKFKKRAGGYARGEARILARVQIPINGD
jgi:hypothetical protein